MPDPAAPPADPTRPLNRLLARLPADDFERLRPQLTTVPVHVRQIFQARNQPIEHVYFLNGGVASVTIGTRDGQLVEVATVGREGVVGIGALFGMHSVTAHTMMQVPDTSAEMMSAAHFRAEMQRGGPLAEATARYTQGFLGLLMQSTACMAMHQTHERCCRWLLMAQDRVESPQFDLSHEFLAMMLGTSRPTVTLVARTLQQAGLIQYSYGHITVTDRAGLEDAACECYATVRDLFTELGL